MAQARLALFLAAALGSVRAGEWESFVANGTECAQPYLAPWELNSSRQNRMLAGESMLWRGIPDWAKRDLMAQPDHAGGDPMRLLFDRLIHPKCHIGWEAPPSQAKLRGFERLIAEREEDARSRILFDFHLGGRDDATYFIVTTPSRLCLTARVVGQLESGGAQGRVVVVRGKEIGKDLCLDPFMPKTWFRLCGPRDVNSASLNEYIFPLIYTIGSEINIVLEDDVALCGSPELLVEHTKKTPLMWLGYRYRHTLGAHMLGVWRSAVPFLLALLQPFTMTPPDLYFLRGCVNPLRAAWSLGSTFPHPSHQRDTLRSPEVAEKGHFQNCSFDGQHSNWLPASSERH